MLKPRPRTQKSPLYSPVPRLDQCLAKTIERGDGPNIPGTDVETHCKVVGAVARELVNRFPPVLRSQLFPSGVELIAAAHDVGKVHPHFLEKLLRSTDYTPNTFPGLRYANPDLDSKVGFHSGVSQSTVVGVGRFIPEILGAHHGKPTEVTSIQNPTAEILGGEEWQSLRLELINRLKAFFAVNWPVVGNDLQALLYTGLTTVADWIGSSSRFDGYSITTEEELQTTVRLAVDEAGFVKPQIKQGLRFSDIFHGYSPRPMQSQVIAIANTPGIFILEDRMGQGKTEAALAAAYSILSQGKATGIYFALPTRLTSDSIYNRFVRYLDAILKTSDQHKARLLHGKAWLYDMEFGEDARPGYPWFEPRKRGLLAPFAVGTVDQALMAVMNVKHGFVRTFGLAGKVVILDEVHTYDAYTGTILDSLIQALYQLGCTVIILSATLTARRIHSLLGLSAPMQEIPQHYPQCIGVSVDDHTNVKVSQPVDAESGSVKVTAVFDESLAFEEVFRRAALGQYVLWIENTVQNSQNVYKVLASWAAANDCDAGLLHARFTGVDRRLLEARWVDAYGKDGRLRPDGRGKILVGTQVLEQSLDIDADFLVTRLAPTDMMLQRIGRLWRHRDVDVHRSSGSVAEVAILMPPRDLYEARGEHSFGDSRFVYAPYVLSRTYEVWFGIDSLKLPKDMRRLLEETYWERSEEPPLQLQLSQLRKDTEKLQRFAHIGMAKAGITWSDTAPTRFSETETRDVLLLKKRPQNDSSTLFFADGGRVELPPKAECTLPRRKKIAREIHEHLLSVPIARIPDPPSLQELSWLKPYLYIGRDEPIVSVAIVNDGGEIRSLHGGEASRTHDLYYLDGLGYVSNKKNQGGTSGT